MRSASASAADAAPHTMKTARSAPSGTAGRSNVAYFVARGVAGAATGRGSAPGATARVDGSPPGTAPNAISGATTGAFGASSPNAMNPSDAANAATHTQRSATRWYRAATGSRSIAAHAKQSAAIVDPIIQEVFIVCSP